MLKHYLRVHDSNWWSVIDTIRYISYKLHGSVRTTLSYIIFKHTMVSPSLHFIGVSPRQQSQP